MTARPPTPVRRGEPTPPKPAVYCFHKMASPRQSIEFAQQKVNARCERSAVDLRAFNPATSLRFARRGTAHMVWPRHPSTPGEGPNDARTRSSSDSPHSAACAVFSLCSVRRALKFGPATQKALSPLGDLVRRAAAADRFTGKSGSTLDIIAPAGLNVPRLVVVGTGKERDLKDRDIVKLGGIAMGKGADVGDSRRRSSPNSRRGARSPSRSPTSRSARGCAPMRSTATRPSARRARSAPTRSKSHLACANPAAAREGLGAAPGGRRRRRAWRAISSTSRPMCFTRGSSPAARRA